MDASRAQKSTIYLWKIIILNVNLQGEGHSFTYCFFYILIIFQKGLAFQILTSGICMYFPILIEVDNGRFTCWKIVDLPLKNVSFAC